MGTIHLMQLCNGGSVTDLTQGLKKFENRHLAEAHIAYILTEVVDVSLVIQAFKI